jgi:hypothetical protein
MLTVNLSAIYKNEGILEYIVTLHIVYSFWYVDYTICKVTCDMTGFPAVKVVLWY